MQLGMLSESQSVSDVMQKVNRGSLSILRVEKLDLGMQNLFGISEKHIKRYRGLIQDNKRHGEKYYEYARESVGDVNIDYLIDKDMELTRMVGDFAIGKELLLAGVSKSTFRSNLFLAETQRKMVKLFSKVK
jgi:uncharacterized linocin/CFP29 family protein